MKWTSAILSILASVTMSGCGPTMGDVKGKVSYGDRAVKSGEVVIFGSDGVPKKAKIERDGTYSVKGVAGGSAKIAILSINPAEVAPTERDKPAVVDPTDVENWFPIDRSYADPNTSGLTATFKGKMAEHDIKMEAKSTPPPPGQRDPHVPGRER